ncbi:MAG: KR domain-containing protein, partial [Myxococcales bacterium]|nr:KR domain-containing protein [Myxococcales bacterium]
PVLALEALGAAVHLITLDIGDGEALASFAARWTAEARPQIRGVFHLAALQHRAPLLELDPSELAADLRPKVDGTEAIWRSFGPTLDLLLLFGSAATVLPSPLIGPYAAANAYLDGFAQARRGGTVEILSIDWGAWDRVGLAARIAEESGRGLDDTGLILMEPESALDDLEHALAFTSTEARMAVLAIDWQRWARLHPTVARMP